MSGIALTSDDFQEAMSRIGVTLDLDAADEWFERLQVDGVLDLEAIHGQVVASTDVEEEVEMLIRVMVKTARDKGIDQLIVAERLRQQLDINTPPAPKPSTGAPRL